MMLKVSRIGFVDAECIRHTPLSACMFAIAFEWLQQPWGDNDLSYLPKFR